MHAFTGAYATFASHFLLILDISTGIDLVPFVQVNTARLDELSSSSALGTHGNISVTQCAVLCGSEGSSACPSFLYNTETGSCQIYGAVYADSPPATTPAPWAYYMVQANVSDCLTLYDAGTTTDGVYTFTIKGGVTVTTWCDMTNGGWTVFQRRQDGSVDFNRTWTEYASGFGDPTAEFWLGLEKIHLLTTKPSQLHIYLEAFNDTTPATAYAMYTTFQVGDTATNFTLSVGGYTGDCGDSMALHDGYMFTTIDADNDVNDVKNCAKVRKGAWWYRACLDANLNGEYHVGNHTTQADHVNWVKCWGRHYSLKMTVMKLKRIARP